MPRFAANLTMMFNEVPFLDRFEAAAKAGFTAVEFLFPYAHPVEEIGKRLHGNGLTQALFNLPPGNWDAGEKGFAALPERFSDLQESLRTALPYAQATGVKRLHLVALPTSTLQADLLIGAGCVETLETSAVSLGEFGPAPRFTAAILSGSIRMMDATCPALHAQFQAAEKGVPFMPLRGLIGSITTSRPWGRKNSAAHTSDLRNAATALGSRRSAIPAIRCTRLTPVACA